MLCLQLYISEERRLLPWEHGTWVERGSQHTQNSLISSLTHVFLWQFWQEVVFATEQPNTSLLVLLVARGGACSWGNGKDALECGNGSFPRSRMGSGGRPCSAIHMGMPQQPSHNFPELQNRSYSTWGKRYPLGQRASIPHSLGTEPSSREQEVWEGCVKGRKPASEPWNCRPLPAEKQQEILVEGDKKTAVVTYLGAIPPVLWGSKPLNSSERNLAHWLQHCPRAPLMALCRKDLPALLKMELLPWTGTTPVPCSLGCSDGQSYPDMTKVIPQGYFAPSYVYMAGLPHLKSVFMMQGFKGLGFVVCFFLMFTACGLF